MSRQPQLMNTPTKILSSVYSRYVHRYWDFRTPLLGILLLLSTSSILANEHAITVFAGGVAGIESLADADASRNFRSAGGGLYLHNSGWGHLKPQQQKEVAAAFVNSPVGIELGYGTGSTAHSWAERYKSGYGSMGIRPIFVAANIFARNNMPSVDGWVSYTSALRRAGVPDSTLILPTFEYANFPTSIATLPANTVSRRADFQAIINTAGGIVLDVPPGVFFRRENAYRQWIVDAIHWTRQHGLKCVLITSPHKSGERFGEDTEQLLEYLDEHNAMPHIIVSENYIENTKPGYINVVGREDIPDTTLGVGQDLIKRILPRLNKPFTGYPNSKREVAPSASPTNMH